MKARDVAEQLSEQDIIDIMEDLGAAGVREDGNSLLFPTICHNGYEATKYKLYYYKESRVFYCYSECHNIGDIFNLVMKVKDIGFREALKYVCDKAGIDENGINVGFKVPKEEKFFDKFKPVNIDEVELIKLPVHDSKILNTFYKLYYRGWIEDNISIEAMDRFNIRFDIANSCIVIPHYNMNDEIVGIRGRFLDEEMVASGMKYLPLRIDDKSYKYQTSAMLYGLNVTQDSIKKYKSIIIGESEKFVMQHYSYYGKESVAAAMSGSSLSDEHIKIIKDLGVEDVTFAVDKEFTNKEEEVEYAKYIKKTLDRLKLHFNVFVIWDKDNLLGHKDSPTDKGKDVFEQLYEKRIMI